MLTGCGFLEPVPASTPSPSATVVDTSRYIGGVIDPAGTTWAGKDSGGDETTITLHADGTVAISYGANSYDYPGDTWRVSDGVLHVEVYLDEVNGSAEYTGVWNAKTSALDTTLITTRTAKKLDLTLTQH
jgi:hypothetical protein